MVVNTRWPSNDPLVAVELNCTSSKAPGVAVPPTATPVPVSRIKEFSILQAVVNLARLLAVAAPSLVTAVQAVSGWGDEVLPAAAFAWLPVEGVVVDAEVGATIPATSTVAGAPARA
jgi:hypothetical protein